MREFLVMVCIVAIGLFLVFFAAFCLVVLAAPVQWALYYISEHIVVPWLHYWRY